MKLSWFSPKIEKRDSGVHGRGLFTADPIEVGEVVCVKGGYVMDRDQRDEVSLKLGPAEIQIAEDLFLGPTSDGEREGGMLHLNHSCDPDLAVQGQVIFVARRPIAEGEELTFDYGTTDDDDWEWECACGATDCRGKVTGRDWNRPDVQAKYDGEFVAYLQRKIDEGRIS